MKINKELIKSISSVLNNDLKSGKYNGYPILKFRLEYVSRKLANFKDIISYDQISDGDARLLLDNNIIDEDVWYELQHYTEIKYKIIERKVGEVFEDLYENKVKVVISAPTRHCYGCLYSRYRCGCDSTNRNIVGACSPSFREDGESVYFEKVTE